MNLRSLVRYLRDARLPRWRRWLVLGGVAYAALPFDLIPDVLPIVGWLDDAGVMAAGFAFLLRDVARHERASAQQLGVGLSTDTRSTGAMLGLSTTPVEPGGPL